MNEHVHASAGRCGAVWSAVTVGAAVVVHALRHDLAPPPGAARFDAWLLAGCAWAVTACACWAVVATGAVAVAAARHGTVARLPCVPEPARRLVLRACGIAAAGAVTGGLALAAPATATPGALQQDRPTTPHEPVVTAAPGPPGTRAPSAAPPRGTHASHLVVHRGGSLWAVAERALGPSASTADVAAYWPRVHRANRSTVGPDPDVVHPGQRLALPPIHPQEER